MHTLMAVNTHTTERVGVHVRQADRPVERYDCFINNNHYYYYL